jgi:DNA-directed RNA polymerase subunit RPC12/RpoP
LGYQLDLGAVSKTVFDFEVRTLECASCGGPIEAPKEGGHTRCSYCGATNVVEHRTADARAHRKPSMAEEVARLSRLKSQLLNPVSGHIYDLERRPMDFGHIDPLGSSGFARLKSTWDQAKTVAAAPPGSEQDRRLCWTALRLADHYRRNRDAIHARAVLETALDRVGDGGLCHLLRCRLASEAVFERDLTSAHGWLDECDAAPEVVELDSAYREALARIREAERNPSAVLDVLGRRHGDIPIQAAYDFQTSLLRIHALELSGAMQAASEEFGRAGSSHGPGEVTAALAKAGFAPQTRGRQGQQDLARKRAIAASLVRERASLGSALSALAVSLLKVPFIAAALMIAVAIPRCSMNRDPLMGVQGYALCPEVCQACEGPMWVFTEWNQTGPGEYTSDGAEYFCMPPAGAQPSQPLRDPRYEMSWVAAFGSTYGILLALSLVFVPPLAFLSFGRTRRKRRELTAKVDEIMREVGGPPPEAQGKSALPGLGIAVGLLVAAFALAAGLTFVAL